MTDDARKFSEWFSKEAKRLQDAYLAAGEEALTRRDAESERAAVEAHKALLNHISLEGVEPPDGWVSFRPN